MCPRGRGWLAGHFWQGEVGIAPESSGCLVLALWWPQHCGCLSAATAAALSLPPTSMGCQPAATQLKGSRSAPARFT